MDLYAAERALRAFGQLDQLTDDMGLALAILRRIGDDVTAANDALVAVKAQIADTTADVLAKIQQLSDQLGTLPADAQATLDEIRAGVQSLDDTVGDADGSDGEPEPAPEG